MDDIISRQAAIDALDKRFDSIPMEQTADILLLRKDLREMPPITPIQELLEVSANRDYWKAQCHAYEAEIERIFDEYVDSNEPHWIPVTERLPENGRQVLVYARSVHYALAKYDEMREADGTYKKQWVTFDAWKPFYSIKEVIAWCEVPEPPEP